MPFPKEPFKALGFDKPMEKAVKYLEGKGVIPSWSWTDVQGAAAHKAFTVAKLAQLDLLNDVFGMLKEAQKSGMTLPEFQKTLKPKLKAAGWWGKITQVNPNTGKPEEVLAGSPWRVATIYRTNIQSAYMAGRQKQMTETSSVLPYWQYLAVGDARTRPAHVALNGAIFKADDPIWQRIYPPNGFNCRCRTRALLESQAKRFAEQGRGRFATAKDKDFSPDNGFDSNPASFEPDIDTSKYPKELAAQYHKQLAKAPPKPEVPEVQEPQETSAERNTRERAERAERERKEMAAFLKSQGLPTGPKPRGANLNPPFGELPKALPNGTPVKFSEDGVPLFFSMKPEEGIEYMRLLGVEVKLDPSPNARKALRYILSDTVRLRNAGLEMPSSITVSEKAMVELVGDVRAGNVAGATTKGDRVTFNPETTTHYDRLGYAQRQHEEGYKSSPSGAHNVTHELAHVAHHVRRNKAGQVDLLTLAAKGQGFTTPEMLELIRTEVSYYGATNAAEFVAEAFAGMASGKTYSSEIMDLYKSLNGPVIKPIKP